MTIQPPRDYSSYLPYARALTARRRTHPQLAARRERAWTMAREAARFLHETYRPARIRLFGSLLTPELFHARRMIGSIERRAVIISGKPARSLVTPETHCLDATRAPRDEAQ